MISVETFASNDQAANALGSDSAYLGGGTLVMRSLNYGGQNFSRIVCSTDPALKQITTSGDRIVIGAGVTMSGIAQSADVPFLATVARSVGGPAVRNMATVGGNLFAQHPYGDFTVALLALDGRVQIAGRREQDLESFLATRGDSNALVTAVSIARPAASDFRWKKVSRVKPKGVSVLSIAAWLPQSAGRVSGARVAFGAMGPTPLRGKGIEAALEGATLDEAGVQAACAAARNDFQPQDDPLASAWYRQEVAPVHLRRLLTGREDG